MTQSKQQNRSVSVLYPPPPFIGCGKEREMITKPVEGIYNIGIDDSIVHLLFMVFCAVFIHNL